MGFTPKARRYVKAGAKVTKATASVSARQAETKRVRAVYGMASPEIATKARERGALSYRTAQARKRRKKRKTPPTSRNCAARLKTPQSAASTSTNMPDRASLSPRQSA